MATRRDDRTARVLLVVAVLLALTGAATVARRSSAPGHATRRAAAARAERVDTCANVPAATPAPTTARPGAAIDVLGTPHQLVLPPEFGLDSAFLVPIRYGSVEEYVKARRPLLPDVWRTAMGRDGFVVAVVTQYKSGTSLVDAEALRFGSPAQAAAFNHDIESALCEARVTRVLTPVAGAPGAVASTYHDFGTAPYRASLVAGDTVVHLGVCHCAVPTGASPLDVTTTWARAVYAQLNRATT